MRMPEIDGVQFLNKIKDIAPDTVRMMLTGNSDIETAVDAVNEGHIFRFLTKPCPPDTMMRALLTGIQQHHLINVERDLLENTLKGAVQALTDILSMTNPIAFSRSKRIKNYMSQLIKLLDINAGWQYEVAAMLSYIGSVTVPLNIIEKFFEGVSLDSSEGSMVKSIPETGKNLLTQIPRMGNIAEMIKLQQDDIVLKKLASPLKDTDVVVLGAMLLETTIDFDAYLCCKYNQADAVDNMRKSAAHYDETVLDLLAQVDVPRLENASSKLIKMADIQEGMLLAQDIKMKNGYLMVAKGYEMNAVVKQRLLNYSKQGIIKDSLRIVCNP